MIDKTTPNGSTLASTIIAIQNSIKEINHEAEIINKNTNAAAESLYGIDSSDLQAVKDRFTGFISIVYNAQGSSLAGLWGRVFEAVYKNPPVLGSTEKANSLRTTITNIALQINTLRVHASIITENTDGQNTAQYGLSSGNKQTILDRLNGVTEFLYNAAGEELTGTEQYFYALLYESLS